MFNGDIKLEENTVDNPLILGGEYVEVGAVPVLSASFLIISNTVGPSMMVLPHVVESTGLHYRWSVVYIVNLISGLHEVPSSLKEFSDAYVQQPIISNIISFVSVFVNACVLAFNFIRAGEIVVLRLILKYHISDG